MKVVIPPSEIQNVDIDTSSFKVFSEKESLWNPIKLEDGEYFVLGDNRNSSSDSRYADVGIVHKGQIIGKLFIK